ncbi:HAD hydrolase-like protein [Burkholderia gladioli]|uniref:HAD hydrolase-like protein n=1 Tax=Burkholderia gladioli TaxID=28095 RepID=UPI003D1A946A
MFEICLFDLDETLVHTDDLEELRIACKNNADSARLKELKAGLANRDNRHIYSKEILNKIRSGFPKLNLGVFTRSPRSYAQTVLDWAYPGFEWDIIVAYEDVKPTKPYGDGIDLAMEHFGVDRLDRVILVGDSDVDVRSAYNCGCLVALDKGAWPSKREHEHWGALEHVPDAVISSPDEILKVLADSSRFLPELERLLVGAASGGRPRFDKINHFVAKAAEADKTPYPIYVCGRSFANYESLRYRKQWHGLTESIEENKESDTFPEEWIKAIRHFIEDQYLSFFKAVRIVVTVVPHRPGRKARLENLLNQLAQSINEDPIEDRVVTCQPGLLAYKPGVQSQHNDHLKRDARFINVRDHLFVQHPETVKAGKSVLVIDDVTTTGASLIYAAKYLKASGAGDVKCLSMAKNIGDIL